MKTKLDFALMLSCCLAVLFSACQKEKVDFTITEISKRSTAENLNEYLRERLPSNVFIESDNHSTTISKYPYLEDYPLLIDTPRDCMYPDCFQLTDTYDELQKLVNLTCQPAIHGICCCLNAIDYCFLITVLPNQFCGDTSKPELLETVLLEKKTSSKPRQVEKLY